MWRTGEGTIWFPAARPGDLTGWRTNYSTL